MKRYGNMEPSGLNDQLHVLAERLARRMQEAHCATRWLDTPRLVLLRLAASELVQAVDLVLTAREHQTTGGKM